MKGYWVGGWGDEGVLGGGAKGYWVGGRVKGGWVRDTGWCFTVSVHLMQVCLPSVVEMFASVASQHEVAFCFTILEHNKRILFSQEVGGGHLTSTLTGSAGANLLDCFFPFDPYQLKR
jgi:hypothetical protein